MSGKHSAILVGSVLAVIVAALFLSIGHASAETIFAAQTDNTVLTITSNDPWIDVTGISSLATGLVKSLSLDYTATSTANGSFQVILTDSTLGRSYVLNPDAVVSATSTLNDGIRVFSFLDCYDLAHSVSYAGGCPVNEGDSLALTVANSTNITPFYFRGSLVGGAYAFFILSDEAVIDFTALYLGAGSQAFAPTGTSTLVANCTDSNVVANSICQVFAYLLAPSSESLSAYGTLVDVYRKKPPFGYFDAAKAEFDVFASTTIATSTQFAALASAGMLLPSLFSTLDVGLASVLLVVLLFYFFHRISNYQL